MNEVVEVSNTAGAAATTSETAEQRRVLREQYKIDTDSLLPIKMEIYNNKDLELDDLGKNERKKLAQKYYDILKNERNKLRQNAIVSEISKSPGLTKMQEWDLRATLESIVKAKQWSGVITNRIMPKVRAAQLTAKPTPATAAEATTGETSAYYSCVYSFKQLRKICKRQTWSRLEVHHELGERGRGVFTTKDFCCGLLVCDYKGKVKTQEDHLHYTNELRQGRDEETYEKVDAYVFEYQAFKSQG